MRKILVADLLCGAGGSSTGCQRALAELGLEMDLVAWAAGIIEGEGTIQGAAYRRSVHGPSVAIRVRVVMSDHDVVARLRDVFGIGRVLPYRNTQGLGSKQLYRWDVSSRADVTMVCRAIYPWMGVRRRSQIDAVLALIADNPPISNAERVRRTWATRRANGAKLFAEVAP